MTLASKPEQSATQSTRRVSCCIADGCGMPFDFDVARADSSPNCVPFYYHYCPAHRYRETPREVIVGIPVTPVHYICGSGEHGCLYDSCFVARSLSDAVDALAETFSLGRTRKARLKHDRHLELRPNRDGAAYCEITSCTCQAPWIHDENMTEEGWNGE